MVYTVKTIRGMAMAELRISTVYLAKDEYGRWRTAGWAYSRSRLPEGAWWQNAAEDWKAQIADYIRRFPIERVWVQYSNQQRKEYTVIEWLLTQADAGKLLAEVRARFEMREKTRNSYRRRP